MPASSTPPPPSLEVVDTVAGAVVDQVSLPDLARSLVISADGSRLFVSIVTDDLLLRGSIVTATTNTIAVLAPPTTDVLRDSPWTRRIGPLCSGFYFLDLEGFVLEVDATPLTVLQILDLSDLPGGAGNVDSLVVLNASGTTAYVGILSSGPPLRQRLSWSTSRAGGIVDTIASTP